MPTDLDDSHSLTTIMVESFPYNITWWGAVVFEKWVKLVTKQIFVSKDDIIKNYSTPASNI